MGDTWDSPGTMTPLSLAAAKHREISERIGALRTTVSVLQQPVFLYRDGKLAGVFRELQNTLKGLQTTEEELCQQTEELAATHQALSVIAEISRIISSSLDINEVYQQFGEQVRKVIPFDRIVLSTIDQDSETLSYQYISGLDIPQRGRGTVVSLAGTITEEAVRTGAPVLLQGETSEALTRRFPGSAPTFDDGLRSFLSVPLLKTGRAIGMLHLRSLSANAYTKSHLALAQSVADQIAGPIANASVYAEHARLQELARELSTPVLPIRARLLLLPLVGVITPERAAQLTERLLSAICASRARVVVIDVTGVAFIDTYVANHLLKTIEAARLLGAAVVVTGISNSVADTLVRLGVDLWKIHTVADLQSGIEEAERMLK